MYIYVYICIADAKGKPEETDELAWGGAGAGCHTERMWVRTGDAGNSDGTESGLQLVRMYVCVCVCVCMYIERDMWVGTCIRTDRQTARTHTHTHACMHAYRSSATSEVYA